MIGIGQAFSIRLRPLVPPADGSACTAAIDPKRALVDVCFAAREVQSKSKVW